MVNRLTNLMNFLLPILVLLRILSAKKDYCIYSNAWHQNWLQLERPPAKGLRHVCQAESPSSSHAHSPFWMSSTYLSICPASRRTLRKAGEWPCPSRCDKNKLWSHLNAACYCILFANLLNLLWVPHFVKTKPRSLAANLLFTVLRGCGFKSCIGQNKELLVRRETGIHLEDHLPLKNEIATLSYTKLRMRSLHTLCYFNCL